MQKHAPVVVRVDAWHAPSDWNDLELVAESADTTVICARAAAHLVVSPLMSSSFTSKSRENDAPGLNSRSVGGSMSTKTDLSLLRVALDLKTPAVVQVSVTHLAHSKGGGSSRAGAGLGFEGVSGHVEPSPGRGAIILIHQCGADSGGGQGAAPRNLEPHAACTLQDALHTADPALPWASREKPHTLCVGSVQPVFAEQAACVAAHKKRTPPHFTMPGSQPKSLTFLRHSTLDRWHVTPSPQLIGRAELLEHGSMPLQALPSAAQEPSAQRFLPEPHCLTVTAPLAVREAV